MTFGEPRSQNDNELSKYLFGKTYLNNLACKLNSTNEIMFLYWMTICFKEIISIKIRVQISRECLNFLDLTNLYQIRIELCLQFQV